jgi:MFS transporter, Spinster family, sphingosine-1-phosphate transporter
MREDAYKKYMLGVLMAVLAFNYVDRQALGLVLQDIKADLHLSDTQLGLLSGIAFALFYSVMGIPIARWADRGNRVTIIAVTTGLWSAAVALCGAAGSFAQLLLIRMTVAVGEAGCIPPAHSLIADHFDRTERPRAVARYLLGPSLSVLIGYFLAGWFNQLYGWRMTFVALGVPGIFLAVLARLTLREPRVAIAPPPTAGTAPTESSEPHPRVLEVCAVLWKNATFRQMLMCFSIVSFFSYGLAQWKPAFFIRSFGLDTGAVGTWFAATYASGGLLGSFLGGELATRFAAHNESRQLKAMALVYCGLAVVSAFMFLAAKPVTAFVLMTFTVICVTAVNGPWFATIQTLVPQRMRAMSIAILYLFGNLIGMGLGPLAVGILSDAYRPWAGDDSLRYALLTLCPGYFWGAWYFWRGSVTVGRDLQTLSPERAR